MEFFGQIVREHGLRVNAPELELRPRCWAMRASEALGHLSRIVVSGGIPDREVPAAAARDALLPHDRFPLILAPRADSIRIFLEGDEAFAAVNVRPDGVLNRGRDADPFLHLCRRRG